MVNGGAHVGHTHAVAQQVDGLVKVVLGDVTQLSASLGIVQQDLGIPEDGSIGPVLVNVLTQFRSNFSGVEQEHAITG